MYFDQKKATVKEKIQNDISRLEEYLNNHKFKELCAVFDLGTKGVRVLVGPRLSIKEFNSWDPDQSDIFYIASLDAQLGIEFEDNHGILDKEISKHFADTISFIAAVRKTLYFIPDNKFKLVGTAVFRWVENRLAVLNQITQATGLSQIQILSEAEEAYYSLLAINYTYNKIGKGKFIAPNFTENDIILLFDQGGGSTEVSYLFPLKPGTTELTSMYHTGTVKLEKKFYLKYRIQQFESTTRKATIEESLHGVKEYVEGHIDAFKGFESILPSKYKSESIFNIYAYGMGTALKVCFELYFGDILHKKISGKKFRGWKMTIGEMESVFRKVQNELENKYVTIDALSNNNPKPGLKPTDDLDAKLQMLYALKAYIYLLNKFKVNNISYAYFNLKYGVYLQNFVTGVSKIYSPPKQEYFQKKKEEIKSANERSNILSGIKPGSEEAHYFHQFAMDTLTLIFGKRLSNPVKEKEIDDGNKRIDIVYDNTASLGFFSRLNSHYKITCPKIVVECKNNSDVSNPAIDQLVGRLNNKRGKFGIIVCRFIGNPDRVLDKCKNVMRDDKGAVIVLSDIDLKSMLRMKEFGQESQIDEYLKDKFDELIM